jgi:hypothetical protein
MLFFESGAKSLNVYEINLNHLQGKDKEMKEPNKQF